MQRKQKRSNWTLMPALLLALGTGACAAQVGDVDDLGYEQEELSLPRPIIPGVEIPREYPELGDLTDRTGRLDDDYVTCNHIQLTLARRAAWEPIYRELGAGSMVNEYVRRLTAVQEHACGDRLSGTNGQRAVRSALSWRNAIDRTIGMGFGVSEEEAGAIREDLVGARMEEIRERCFGADTIDPSLFPIARFPLTPDRGFDVPAVTPADVWGDCPVGGPRNRGSDPVGGGSGSATGSFDPSALQECIADFASSSSDCSSPVGQEAPPETNPSGPTNPSQPAEPQPGSTPAPTWQNCGSYECYQQRTVNGTEVTRRGGVRTGDREVTWEIRTKHGVMVGVRTTVRDRETGEIIDQQNVQLAEATAELISDAKGIVDAVTEVLGVAREAVDLLRDLKEFVNELMGSDGSDGPQTDLRLCQPANPGSTTPVGYARPEPIDPLSGSPGVITGEDAFAYCLCNQGRTGRELANSMGFHCDNSDWLDRVECTRGDCPECGLVMSDPSNPPECMLMLVQDNGESTLDRVQDACESVLTCPTGTSAFTGADTTGLRCSCRPQSGGGSGTGRTAECSVVNCRTIEPGSPGYQRCCGSSVPLPGPLPIPFTPRF